MQLQWARRRGTARARGHTCTPGSTILTKLGKANFVPHAQSGLGVRARTAAAAASASYQYRTLLAIAAAAAAFGVEASTPQRPLSPRVNVTVYHVASANYTGERKPRAETYSA